MPVTPEDSQKAYLWPYRIFPEPGPAPARAEAPMLRRRERSQRPLFQMGNQTGSIQAPRIGSLLCELRSTVTKLAALTLHGRHWLLAQVQVQPDHHEYYQRNQGLRQGRTAG